MKQPSLSLSELNQAPSKQVQVGQIPTAIIALSTPTHIFEQRSEIDVDTEGYFQEPQSRQDYPSNGVASLEELLEAGGLTGC